MPPREVANAAESGLVARAVQQPQLAHRNRAQYRWQTAAMVEVGVGRNGEIQLANPQRRQRGKHDARAEIEAAAQRRPGIDQDRGIEALGDQGIALPHVEEYGAIRGDSEASARCVRRLPRRAIDEPATPYLARRVPNVELLLVDQLDGGRG